MAEVVVVEEVVEVVEVSGPVTVVGVPGAMEVVEIADPSGFVVVESPPEVLEVVGPSEFMAVVAESVTVVEAGTQGPAGATGAAGPQGPPGNGTPVRETPAGVVNGSNGVFTLSAVPVAGSDQVYLNGLLQEAGVDYSLSGAVVTFAETPLPGDRVRACYLT